MRHRIKFGKIGSFDPEKTKIEVQDLEREEVSEEIEEIFEEELSIETMMKLWQRWSSMILLTKLNK